MKPDKLVLLIVSFIFVYLVSLPFVVKATTMLDYEPTGNALDVLLAFYRPVVFLLDHCEPYNVLIVSLAKLLHTHI